MSGTTRKPWGGKLETAPVGTRAVEGPDNLDMVGLHLRKFTELSFLAALVAVPLMYHYSLRASWMEWLRDNLEPHWLYTDQLAPFFMGMMPVLESKFGAWFYLGILMMAGFAATRLLEKLSGRPIFYPVETAGASARAARHRFIPLIAIVAFLVYALASFLFWPPSIPPEARAAGAGEATAAAVSQLGGGGFFFSSVAWLMVAFALFFFLVAEDIIRRRTLANKVLGVLVMMGALNAVVVIMQKIEFGPLMTFWFKFPPEESRNNLGGFIGHNTGMSSFLIAPTLLCLTWIISLTPRRDRMFRFASACGFLLMMTALILAQSRAVIPILIGCAIALAVILKRRGCLLPQSRAYIWIPVAIFFVLLTQLVPNRLNPLYREDVTMTERVGEFRVERLLTETRLRILAVSATQLIPERPLHGHGFGTFQYVYPRAQGRYFELYPDTRLAPTPHRTMRAHNEYLQVLIELGLLGLGVALTGLYFLLRGGWNIMRRTLMPHHIASQAGIFLSIVAILLHAFFDFPLRVPPIAIALVALLAVWSAGDRLWLFPAKAPEDEDALALKETREDIEEIRRTIRPGLVAALGVAFLLLFVFAAAWISSRTMSRFLTAVTLETRAQSFLAAVPRNPHLLNDAWRDIDDAKRILWISGPINRTQAHVRFYQAHATYNETQRAIQEGEEDLAAYIRDLAETRTRAGITSLNMALQEERFHFIYRLRSLLAQLIAQHSTGATREEFDTRALDDLYRAVTMNPGDGEGIVELIRYLERNPAYNRSEIVRHMRTLHRFHLDRFRSDVYGQALDALSLDELDDAWRRMRLVVEAVPTDPEFRITWASILTAVGEYEPAREILAEFLDEGHAGTAEQEALYEAARIVQLEIEIAVGNEEYVLSRLRTQRFRNAPGPLIRSMQLLLMKRTGVPDEDLSLLRQELVTSGLANPLVYQIAGATAYRIFGDMEEAIFWLERRQRLRPPAPEMDLQGHVFLAHAYIRTGQLERAEALLPRIQEKGDTPYARRLARNIAMRMAAQIEEARERADGS